MTVEEAAALIAPAVHAPPDAEGAWADLGAGGGTFSRALAALLGPRGHVHAVDRERAAVATLARLPRDPSAAPITAVRADFADAAAWGALALPPLDGVLLANALHFVPWAEQGAVLARIAARLRAGGRLVVVEYDDRPASRWVPYPVSLARLGTVVPPDLTPPVRVGARRSAFGGTMYAACSARRAEQGAGSREQGAREQGVRE